MLTIPLWRCQKCPWQGYIRTGHQWTFRVLPDRQEQGSFTEFIAMIEALRSAKPGLVEITERAKCPECGSWEMTKEDVPVDEEGGAP